MSNQFTERYKSLTTVQLMDVILNPQNYQEAAVKAAEIELQTRNIANEEAETAKKIVIERVDKEKKREQKIQKLTGGITELVDPTKKKSPDMILKLVCIGLSLFTAYNMYQSYRFILAFMSTDFSIYDLSILVVFFGYAYIIATIALLWLRNKVGYYLLYVWDIYYLAIALINLYQYLEYGGSLTDDLLVLLYNRFGIGLLIYVSVFIILNTKKFKSAFDSVKEMEDVEHLIDEIKP